MLGVRPIPIFAHIKIIVKFEIRYHPHTFPHPPHHLLLCYPFPPLNIDPNLDLLRLLRFEDREINQIGGILVKDKGEKVRAKGKGKKGKGEKQKPNRREFCF